MRLELNKPFTMQIKTFLDKFNPWIGLAASLCIIIPSLYDILDDPLKFTNEHLILLGGLVVMVYFLKQIFDRIINLDDLD
jgi:hypothetical protein